MWCRGGGGSAKPAVLRSMCGELPTTHVADKKRKKETTDGKKAGTPRTAHWKTGHERCDETIFLGCHLYAPNPKSHTLAVLCRVAEQVVTRVTRKSPRSLSQEDKQKIRTERLPRRHPRTSDVAVFGNLRLWRRKKQGTEGRTSLPTYLTNHIFFTLRLLACLSFFCFDIETATSRARQRGSDRSVPKES